MKISGWGRYPRIESTCVGMRDAGDGRATLAAHASLIPRGNGRSYGDATLNLKCVISTLRCDHILAFDRRSGIVTCEAGLLLSDLLHFAVPHGFFAPVTPGTRFVSIGGMIAADVHGKNHHSAGSFTRHVTDLLLLLPDGTTRRCSRTEDSELFDATCGGMGLTGIILEATFGLLPIESAWIRQDAVKAADLDAMLVASADSASWTYSVAWIDCLARGKSLGRGLVYRGEHAAAAECPRGADPLVPPNHRVKRVPVDCPGFMLNRLSVAAFNEVYFRRGKPGGSVPDYETFFYPLDAVLEWNRIYGRPGFVQYQCVIPLAQSAEGMRRLLECIGAAGHGSFLAVLKLFGPGDPGYLSFPMEGYTLALDFPASTATFNLLLQLDAIVAAHGGRLYLAKDARSSASMMRLGYPKLAQFAAVRDRIDPGRKLNSLLAERLGL